MRIDACMEMLFRNKDRVIGSDERGVLFKKKNGNIHHFSHASCSFIEILEEAESAGDITFDALQQLMKAWIPDELNQGIGFGELIDCCIFSNSLINEQELDSSNSFIIAYKIEFNYRYGKDYVYCNERQPLNSNGKPLCTIAKTNLLENANNAIKIGKFKIAHGD